MFLVLLIKVVAAQFPVSRLLLQSVIGNHPDRVGYSNSRSLGSFANLEVVELRSQVSLTRPPLKHSLTGRSPAAIVVLLGSLCVSRKLAVRWRAVRCSSREWVRW